MPAFIHRRRVQFSETDMAGIVHFANFYRWMEETEHEFLRSVGLGIMERQSDGTYIGWPRVNTTCHYEAPAHYEDLIDIHLSVERIGVKSVTYYFEFFLDGKRLAFGRAKAACCICHPDATLKSIEIPESYLAVLQEEPRG
jgi:YbgC/YbaW family acyl-CoA thioester hydrolase